MGESRGRRAGAAGAALCACAALALLTAALGTSRWVEAHARRTSNPLESAGAVSFGLFHGDKRLNPGYGWRHYLLNALGGGGGFPARRWAWAGAGALVCAAGACAGAAGVLAALQAATRPPPARPRPAAPLLVTSGLLVLLSVGAVCVWTTEFSLRLVHNVLSEEELANMWTSEGTAHLGLSFWLLVGACVSGCACFVCACAGVLQRRDKPAPELHEKHNAAIMLY